MRLEPNKGRLLSGCLSSNASIPGPPMGTGRTRCSGKERGLGLRLEKPSALTSVRGTSGSGTRPKSNCGSFSPRHHGSTDKRYGFEVKFHDSPLEYPMDNSLDARGRDRLLQGATNQGSTLYAAQA